MFSFEFSDTNFQERCWYLLHIANTKTHFHVFICFLLHIFMIIHDCCFLFPIRQIFFFMILLYLQVKSNKSKDILTIEAILILTWCKVQDSFRGVGFWSGNKTEWLISDSSREKIRLQVGQSLVALLCISIVFSMFCSVILVSWYLLVPTEPTVLIAYAVWLWILMPFWRS